MLKRVAILQSNYIPWRGYFDLMGSVDEFVIYDSVQFTKNDWRNRNRIKTSAGVRWLTIPVETAGRSGQRICDTRVAQSDWTVKHWRSIEQAYARAPFFRTFRDRLELAYRACAKLRQLSAINRTLMEVVAAELGLSTPISDAAPDARITDPTERLVAICRSLGAGVYVSGPRGLNYLNLPTFERAGIAVEFFDYSSYRPYPQLHGPYDPALSVIDLLFNVGDEVDKFLSCGESLLRRRRR